MHTNPLASWQTWLKFVLPSLLGVWLFMTPTPWQGEVTIPVVFLAKFLVGSVEAFLVPLIVAIISLTTLASVLVRLLQPKALQQYFPFVYQLLNANNLWLAIRLLGAACALAVYFQWGPEIVWSEDTGGLLLEDLLTSLFGVFIIAGLLLPLLLNFGLLELLGTLLSKVMRPLFGLPGRAAIDSTASWLGDGSVGILLTRKQYQQKFYTQKEAAIVGTTFSAVSLTFSLIVLTQVGLEAMFLPFYLTVCVAGIVAALIVPRLPPLRGKKQLFIDGTERTQDPDLVPAGRGLWSYGLERARIKAQSASFKQGVLVEGVKNASEMVFAILPVIMAIGTLALVLAEGTPIFAYLGMPFVPLLELLQIPEAAAASQTMVVGFADMFLPAILATGIESDMTRFVIAALSVTQLIYMSEVGALLLGSRLPLNIAELFLIFLLRTLVTLPVIALMAHWIF